VINGENSHGKGEKKRKVVQTYSSFTLPHKTYIEEPEGGQEIPNPPEGTKVSKGNS